jgi:two-component system nitrogen regulation sensor histidine kinase NtrY
MTAEAPSIAPVAVDRFGGNVGRQRHEYSKVIRAAGYVAVFLALTSATATFLVLMGLTPVQPTEQTVVYAMIVNGVLVAFLIFVVGWELGALVLARRRGRAAARLHIRIVGLFSLVAVAPALLVAVIASITLDRGLDNWFSTRTREIVDTSASIASAYVQQQAQIVRTDLLAMKGEVERARSILLSDPDSFQAHLNELASSRGISGVFLMSGEGIEVAQAISGPLIDFPPPPPGGITEAKANGGQPVLIAPGEQNVMGALVQLADYNNMFLYIVRPIDPKVARYVSLTAENVAEYNSLEASRFGTQIAFAILYLGISLVVLLSAIWVGISFANRLVSPIRRLIDAAEQVAGGNLAVKVPVSRSAGDVAALAETFNSMTDQLRNQRQELLSASEQMDRRRRFTEAVLSGVTAGVIGVDGDGRISIANRTALRMINIPAEKVIDRPVGEVIPSLEPVVTAALHSDRPEYRDQIVLATTGRERTINVRVTTERPAAGAHGYVVTLDDITDLVTAQRSSAWADVARRIAHEIKNPLTPIQLSAERLRRKFGKVITEDRAVFDQCTDTIVRQVGDIGRMVDEFSSFARMPKPTFEVRNLAEAVREAVFLLEVSHSDIVFSLDLPAEPLMGRFDARLMGQALTNLVKNATEAIASQRAVEPVEGRIHVKAGIVDDSIVVDVIDNGIGLPQENRHRLLEPYMTTREKGTGLGLAIVTKIVEEHGGRIELLDSPEVATGGRGAMIRLVLPTIEEPSRAEDAVRPLEAAK